MTEPSAALVAPAVSDPVPDILENALDGSLVSPTYLLGEALVFCGLVGKNDPWNFVTEQVAGNWGTMQEAGKSALPDRECMRPFGADVMRPRI